MRECGHGNLGDCVTEPEVNEIYFSVMNQLTNELSDLFIQSSIHLFILHSAIFIHSYVFIHPYSLTINHLFVHSLYAPCLQSTQPIALSLMSSPPSACGNEAQWISWSLKYKEIGSFERMQNQID